MSSKKKLSSRHVGSFDRLRFWPPFFHIWSRDRPINWKLLRRLLSGSPHPPEQKFPCIFICFSLCVPNFFYCTKKLHDYDRAYSLPSFFTARQCGQLKSFSNQIFCYLHFGSFSWISPADFMLDSEQVSVQQNKFMSLHCVHHFTSLSNVCIYNTCSSIVYVK